MNPHLLYMPVLLVLGGCATPAPIATNPIASAAPMVPQPPVRQEPSERGSQDASAGEHVITRYELGSYRYPRTSELEGAIFRSTRISSQYGAAGGVTRSNYPPASFEPLPPSEELRAELSAQRDITSRIQHAQDTIVRLEKQVREQYDSLVVQTKETVELRQSLEAERGRLQGLQAQLQEQLTASAASPPVAQAPVEAPTPEIKW